MRKLSIIVPVYNAAEYLEKCVDSLLQQNVEDYEIILINDGSKDNSLEILNRYQQSWPDRIVVLDITNGGQGRARNFALDIAQGEYIGFADSDDWADTAMFSKMLSAAEEKQADIVICDSWCVDGEKKTYEKAALQGSALAASGSVWNKLFRRDLIGEIRFPEGFWYEDFSFSAKLLLKTDKIVFLPEALYYYRSGHASTMRNQNAKKNLDMLVIMKDISDFLGTEKRDELEFLIINHVLLDSIKRVNLQNAPDKKQVIKVFRDYVQDNIPKLSACASFQKETRNRRIIMWLNYHGLEDVSQAILKIKG